MAITQNDPITASDVMAALNEKAGSIHVHVKSDITDFSHTHAKSDITDFPAIPTKTSQLTNDSGFLTSLPSHIHDERYYTESEVKNMLWNITKYNSVHSAGTELTVVHLPSCELGERKYFNCTIVYDTSLKQDKDIYLNAININYEGE